MHSVQRRSKPFVSDVGKIRAARMWTIALSDHPKELSLTTYVCRVEQMSSNLEWQ